MSKHIYRTTRKYKCPYCDLKATRAELIDHVAKKHDELIPEGYTADRAVYDFINGKNYGTCMICKSKVYDWNSKVGRYNNLCNNPNCRKEVRRIALERHLKVYNKPTLLNDPEQQEKMLANRKISGNYTFSDGGRVTYTGQYEKKALEFMDNVMGVKSTEIQAPGPVLEYTYGGKIHKWITDIFYIPANLLIEIKDGGSNPNNRSMIEYREKQVAKETMVTDLGTFNYVRLTDNNFAQLLDILAELKYDALNEENPKARVNINESANTLFTEGKVKYVNDKGQKVPKVCPKCGSKVGIYFKGEPVFICSNKECKKYFGVLPFNEEVGGLPPHRPPEAYIIPYGQNNVFAGFAYTDSISSQIAKLTDEDKIELISEEDFYSRYQTGPVMIFVESEEKINERINYIHSNMDFLHKDYDPNYFVECLLEKPVFSFADIAISEKFKYYDKEREEKICKFIENGIVARFENDIDTTKFIDTSNVVKTDGNVMICISASGYYASTPNDFYMASDTYNSIEDLMTSGVVDLMNDIYTSNSGRKKEDIDDPTD